MTTDIKTLPARQIEALRCLTVVAERAGGTVADVTWLHRSNNGRGYMGVTELHVEIEVSEAVCVLVYFDGVAVGRGGWFGYNYTETIADRNATNRFLTARCGECWGDVAARGW